MIKRVNIKSWNNSERGSWLCPWCEKPVKGGVCPECHRAFVVFWVLPKKFQNPQNKDEEDEQKKEEQVIIFYWTKTVQVGGLRTRLVFSPINSRLPLEIFALDAEKNFFPAEPQLMSWGALLAERIDTEFSPQFPL